ncbi:hypothetical protein [Pseudochelatococcus sp. G4_1912]
MADKNTHGTEVGTEVPGSFFVVGVIIAFVLIALVTYTNVTLGL